MPDRFRLLHVEDDRDFSEMLQLQLLRISRQGGQAVLDILSVPDVASAIEAISATAFDCILCDYQIQGGTGLDVLAHVRSEQLLVPVLFLTGQGDESVAREAFVKGADDYFTKELGIARYDRIYNAIIHQISHYIIEREHQELERRYKTSQKNYYALFYNAPEAILLMDGCTILECNPASVELLGYSKEELGALEPHSFSPEFQPDGSESLTRFKLFISKVIQGEPQRFMWEHLRKDGTPIMAEVRLSPIFIDHKSLVIAIIRDISSMLDMSFELKESKRKLATLIHNLPGMAYQCASEYPWKMTYVSRGCKQLTGYSREELLFPPLGSFASLIHPADRPYVRGEVEKALASSTYFEVYYRIKCSDGSVSKVYERGCGVVDENGTTLLEGFIMSISAKSGEHPSPSASVPHDIIETFPLAVVMYAVSHGELSHLYSNGAAEKLPFARGGDSELPFAEYLSGMYAEKLLSLGSQQFPHQSFQLQYESDSGAKHVCVWGLRYSDDVLYAVCTDVSPRAELDAIEKESHRRNERVMALVSDINVLDIDKVLQNVAGYIRSIVPYDGMVVFAVDRERGVFVPLYCDDDMRDAMMPLTFPLNQGVTGRVACNGIPEVVNVTHRDSDAIHVPGTPDNEERMLSIPLIGHQGTIGALNLYREHEDFHDSDLREASLISSHVAAALENALLFEKISNEHEFINFLISLLSHDLKSPIMASDGLIDALEVTGAQAPIGSKLRWANQRVKNILERTLLFAHLEYGLIEREYKLYRVSSLMADVQEHFENHPKAGNIRVECECDTCSIYALDLFPHIIINLVDNALKYGTTCVVNCFPSGDAVTIRVTDDGMGIPASKQNLVFSKFARLDKNSSVSGSGIGLFVAKHLVELHHGDISIAGNIPTGTIIEVSIPRDCRKRMISAHD